MSATYHHTPTESADAEPSPPHITVQAAGRWWHLHRAADLEKLWEAMATDPRTVDDERLPYWTELWPSSVALANWLAQKQRDIRGRPCLDMGCGLGLTAMVGQSLGAHVLAMDYEADALRFAFGNARANACPQPLWTLMDWRSPAVLAGSLHRIWGGDIMYEKRFVRPVLRFLGHALARGGVAWLAEPGRSVYDAFLQALYDNGWQGRCVYSENVAPLYAQPMPVTVRIWELQARRLTRV